MLAPTSGARGGLRVEVRGCAIGLEGLEAINISYHHKLFRTLERFIRPYSIAAGL